MSKFDQCWVSGSLDSPDEKDLFFYTSAPELRFTYFDLASLTKVLATSALLAWHKLDLKLDWDQFLKTKVSQTICELKGGALEGVRVGDLWEHRSGLKDHFLIFSSREGPQLKRSEKTHLAICKIVEKHSEHSMKKETVYSDLGFLLLGFYLERFYEKTLGQLFEDFKLELGIESLKIKFSNQIISSDSVLATESRHLAGEVNDDNAAALGGVAAHAGLFAQPVDLFFFIKHLYAWSQEKAALRDWWRPCGAGRFYRGWDRCSGAPSSQAGFPASDLVIGHLGYTGTALWIDPVSKKVGIHLSNRIAPDDSEESKSQIKKLRQKLFTSYWKGTIEETCRKEIL